MRKPYIEVSCVFIILILATLLTGCGSFIASMDIKSSRHRLNEAVTATAEEQLLLALVQTRFVHNPGFLDVSSINSQLNWSAGIGGSYSTGPSSGTVSPSIDYSESPTITYTPLQGQEFVRRMMLPVSMETLAMLIESGWSSGAVLRMAVQSINEIPNGFRGSVTKETLPKYKKFNRVADLFSRMMSRGEIVWSMFPDHHYPITSWDWNNPENFKSGSVVKNNWEPTDNPLLINFDRPARIKSKIAESEHTELMNLLGLSMEALKPINSKNPKFDSLVVQNIIRPGSEGDIWIHSRSMQQILYALSWSVQVPPDVELRGEVQAIKDAEGEPFDWSEMYQDLLNIHWSDSHPDNAAIAVEYQDYWYFVRRDDIASKRTFILLGQLMKMLSGLGSDSAPALTLPL